MALRHAVIGAPLVLLLLAGCVPTPEPGPGASGMPLPSPTLTPNPTPTITPTPSPETEPVGKDCEELISLETLYEFNPNVSLLPSFSPDEDSLAGQALAQQGVACEIVNQTSGTTIDIGVVRYTDAAYAAKVAAVTASSTTTGAYDGFFDITDGAGVGQAFSAPYWVTIVSAEFLSAPDAALLLTAAVDALG